YVEVVKSDVMSIQSEHCQSGHVSNSRIANDEIAGTRCTESIQAAVHLDEMKLELAVQKDQSCCILGDISKAVYEAGVLSRRGVNPYSFQRAHMRYCRRVLALDSECPKIQALHPRRHRIVVQDILNLQSRTIAQVGIIARHVQLYPGQITTVYAFICDSAR